MSRQSPFARRSELMASLWACPSATWERYRQGHKDEAPQTQARDRWNNLTGIGSAQAPLL